MFDWNEFLNFAEELTVGSLNEAAARAAISRAYYATFHAGRGYLDGAGIRLDRGRNAHLQVAVELGMKSVEIEREMQRLHTWRKQADYDDELPFSDADEQAQTYVAVARRIISDIEAIT